MIDNGTAVARCPGGRPRGWVGPERVLHFNVAHRFEAHDSFSYTPLMLASVK